MTKAELIEWLEKEIERYNKQTWLSDEHKQVCTTVFCKCLAKAKQLEEPKQ
jgi:hypothetical protein